MQKSSHPQLAAGPLSGQVAPTVVGPDRDRTELYLALGVLAILGLGVSAFWISSRTGEGESGATTIAKRDMTFGSPSQPGLAEAKATMPAISTIQTIRQPAVTTETDIKHGDLYFEVGRKGLTNEAKVLLQIHGELLKQNPDWGVVLQGYTDQQGSAEYNKKLGLRRAEAVREHLIGLGVADTSIKVVSLGKDGALCGDTSDTCSRMNRRVHLELRRVGVEHLAAPTTTPLLISGQDGPSDQPSTASSSLTEIEESTHAETPVAAAQTPAIDKSDAGQ